MPSKSEYYIVFPLDKMAEVNAQAEGWDEIGCPNMFNGTARFAESADPIVHTHHGASILTTDAVGESIETLPGLVSGAYVFKGGGWPSVLSSMSLVKHVEDDDD